jgi:hypothetical protein
MTRADDERTLDLLRYALEREKVRGDYRIDPGPGEFADEGSSLVRGWFGWKLTHDERGQRRTIGRFTSLSGAANCFFHDVTRPSPLMRYFEDWKAERYGDDWPPR